MYKIGIALCVALFFGSAHARAAELDTYVESLRHPELLWRKRDLRTPFQKPDDAQRFTDLESMIENYAPRVWWHSEDSWAPMDPLQFIKESALYFRSVFGHERLIADEGRIDPKALGALRVKGIQRPYQSGFLFNGAGFFLRHRGGPAHLDPLKARATPIFWRISPGPLSTSFSATSATPSERGQTRKVLIEYWYHVGFNRAPAMGIGDHQGDWEGLAMLLEFGFENGRFSHRPLAAYFSEHEGGIWICANDLHFVQNQAHPEAFSANGTHATYPSPGDHPAGLITDRTNRGWNWDTWKNVVPLELESFYGFPGAWGEPRFFSFMTGPLVPGPGYKWLPRGSEARESRQILESHCQI